MRTADVAFVPLFAGIGFDRLSLKRSGLRRKFGQIGRRVRRWRHRRAGLFIVSETGWTNPSTLDLLGVKSGVRGGDFWRGGSWEHAGGECAGTRVLVGPPLCVRLRVGIKRWRMVWTSTWIWTVGGADWGVLGSGPVEGWRLGVAGGWCGWRVRHLRLV